MAERDHRLEEARAVEEDTPGVSIHEGDDQILMEETSDREQNAVGSESREAEPDYRDLYLRELAEKDNFRKGLRKKESEIQKYAGKETVKRLIPVLDHFLLAIDHGEAGDGVQMAFKELMEVLTSEGLEEIEVPEGAVFDPSIHHALSILEDPEVDQEVVKQVHRRGYAFKGHVLRAPEVVVAQPAWQRRDEKS
jgi:molecular chaperone GrpE